MAPRKTLSTTTSTKRVGQKAADKPLADKPLAKTLAPMIVRYVEPPAREEIAQRAYELFVSRGRTHGQDVVDWLRAEAELLTRG